MKWAWLLVLAAAGPAVAGTGHAPKRKSAQTLRYHAVVPGHRDPAASLDQQLLPQEPLADKVKTPDEGFSIYWPGIAFSLVLLAGMIWAWQFGVRGAPLVLALLAILCAYLSLGGRRYFHLLGNQQGYEPVQPIAFSHAIHAGKLKISCFYCHYGARSSDVAGVPAVSVCMNCHNVVKGMAGSKEPSAEIAKLLHFWDARATPEAATIPWVRVHHLPDFAHFSHRVHIANGIQCQECHGPIQKMDRVRQAASLSMGWCIQCHRLRPGQAPTHWKRVGGPTDCAACHW
ncbi:MAG: cytochrome c3 family protein [Elusimicrobia bacterium]|nr:cytochrome c3 family protein [Elusimicrobiota bacterium]MDE2425973.1 cytochrome c3 family protein [Elusimicrobiota bacterium]